MGGRYLVTKEIVLLDSGVLVNLLATNKHEEILNSTNKVYKICSDVSRETLYLRSEEDLNQRVPVGVESLAKSMGLQIVDVENEEEAGLYINYCIHLDDSEAMSLALSRSRNYNLATDERKIRKLFFEDVKDQARLLYTSDLVKLWATVTNQSIEAIKEIINKVKIKAKFIPSTDDPNFVWWEKFL